MSESEIEVIMKDCHVNTNISHDGNLNMRR